MKCQNCGQNEANFFQHSNINGKITETNLCAECAEKLGLMRGFNPVSIFDGFFPRRSGFFPPFFGFSEQREAMPAPQRAETAVIEPDAELSRLRELNMLREQMRAAAHSEDFERAIELRERLRELEAQ